ncbi:proton-coupled folate transporter-like [Tubulanus polymorphus]|uniref:proton-coupled folate transporter-like n=1 Tax=Tubulanus polymorphus TaxID=672921 RepID=UPI003DA6C303
MKRPLLSNEVETINNEESEEPDDEETNLIRHHQKLRRSHSVVIPRRRVVVEPIVFLYCTAVIGNLPVSQQYLYSRFGNSSYLKDGVNRCNFSSTNDSTSIAILYMQEHTAKWLQYISLAGSVLSIFVVPFLGSYSDRAGRRIAFIVPSVFTLLKFILNAFVIYFKLPVYVLVLAAGLDGFGGSIAAMFMVAFIYISDITSPMERAIRITILEGLIMFSMAVSQLGLGYWIDASGFLYPYLALIGLLILNLIYIVFFVPETLIVEKNKEARFSMITELKAILSVLKTKENGRRIKIVFLNILIFLVVFTNVSTVNVRLLFLMNIPFCWGPIKLGIFGAIGAVANQVISVISVKIFKFCLSEMWISLIGIFSSMASLLLFSFSEHEWELYLACVIGGMVSAIVAMYRALLSHLVHAHELGAVFALTACVEAICMLIATPVMSEVYEITVSINPGFVFFMNSLILTVAVIFVLVYVCYERRIDRYERREPFHIQS